MLVSHQDTLDSDRAKAAIWQRLQMKSVRPFCSDMFQWPGPTLNTRADCAVGMQLNRFNAQNYHAVCLLPESRKQLLNVGETKVWLHSFQSPLRSPWYGGSPPKAMAFRRLCQWNLIHAVADTVIQSLCAALGLNGGSLLFSQATKW